MARIKAIRDIFADHVEQPTHYHYNRWQTLFRDPFSRMRGVEKWQIVSPDGDVIDLSNIDANVNTTDINERFAFVSKFTGTAGQATLNYAAGANITTLELDVDGDGRADFRIAITGNHTGTTGNMWDGTSDANGGWYL